MKKSLLVIAATALMGSASAFAADMPMKAPAYRAAAPVYNWTGFYVGGLVGYGWGTSTHFESGGVGPDADTNGWNGGVTLGYNWQLANWVLGLEGDWSWADMKAASQTTPAFGCVGTCDTEIKSFGTLRGRVGYAFDRLLPYLTAGVAFTQLEASIGTPVLESGSTTKSSLTVGGGVEYSFLPNWSAKIEYLHVSKLDDFAYAPSECDVATGGCFVKDVHHDELRVGLNYKFGG